ncbi:hypothetical protein TNCV_2906891 [Trichonephila clavipes]|nr:hypothetical protein TNCV_2906891 [Trichonephila clavipes]
MDSFLVLPSFVPLRRQLISGSLRRPARSVEVGEIISNILNRWVVIPIYSIKEVSGDFTDSLPNSGDIKVSSEINIPHIPFSFILWVSGELPKISGSVPLLEEVFELTQYKWGGWCKNIYPIFYNIVIESISSGVSTMATPRADFAGINNPNVLEEKIALSTSTVRSVHQLAPKPIENKKHTYTSNHIQELIREKNRAKKL